MKNSTAGRDRDGYGGRRIDLVDDERVLGRIVTEVTMHAHLARCESGMKRMHPLSTVAGSNGIARPTTWSRPSTPR